MKNNVLSSCRWTSAPPSVSDLQHRASWRVVPQRRLFALRSCRVIERERAAVRSVFSMYGEPSWVWACVCCCQVRLPLSWCCSVRQRASGCNATWTTTPKRWRLSGNTSRLILTTIEHMTHSHWMICLPGVKRAAGWRLAKKNSQQCFYPHTESSLNYVFLSVHAK